jgi:ribosome biogenesis GTPase
MGWSPRFAALLEFLEHPGAEPGRVSCLHRDRVDLLTARGPLSGEVSGRFRNRVTRAEEWPAVGDWVAYTPSPDGSIGVIHHVLDRATVLSRRSANTSDVQVLAANLDRVFVVTSANHDFNLRRVERFLTIVLEGGSRPEVVLTKLDIAKEPVEFYLEQLATITLGAPVHPVSAYTGVGMSEFANSCVPGETVALVGTSGIGKSTLLNALSGDLNLEVGAVREFDGKGRHTTTRRELFVLPERGVVIDTPGLRGLALIDADEGVGDAFADVAELAVGCRFNDCGHQTEPGCAVLTAVETGELDAKRLKSYRKLLRELEAERAREDPALARERRDRWKVITKSMRKHPSKGTGR